MSEFEKKKCLEDKYNFGCFVIGMLTVLLLENLGLILLQTTTVLDYPNIFIGYFPIIFTIIVQLIADKFINETMVPDIYFTKGILGMFLILLCDKIIIPILTNYESIGDTYSYAWYMFIIYISPSFIYTFASLIYYFFKKLVRNIKINMYYDSLYYQELINSENNEQIEEKNNNEVNNESLNNNINESSNENPNKDIFDISGGFVKKLSKKIEENIEK